MQGTALKPCTFILFRRHLTRLFKDLEIVMTSRDRHQFLLQQSVCIRVATAVLSGFWEIEQGGGIGSAAVKYYSPTVAEGKTLTA